MKARETFPGLTHKGKVAFVTGGGSGIGLETALTLADLGANVAVLDWTPGASDAAAKRIAKMGRKALAFEGDTGDEKTVVDAFAATKKKLGPIDVAVACAGVLGDGGPVFTTSVEDFERVMGVNVRGAFLVTREAAKHMRPRKSGAIVLLSSLDGPAGGARHVFLLHVKRRASQPRPRRGARPRPGPRDRQLYLSQCHSHTTSRGKAGNLAERR